MSAMAKLKISDEEELLWEDTCKDEWQRALGLVAQLQKDLQELRARLVEKESLAEQKKLLLHSASMREQALRSELLKSETLLWG